MDEKRRNNVSNLSKKMQWRVRVEFAIQAGMVFLSLLTALMLIMNIFLFKPFGFPAVSFHFLLFYTAFSVTGCLTLCWLGCRQRPFHQQQPSGGVLDV